MKKIAQAMLTALAVRRKDNIYRWYYYHSM